MSYTPTTWQTGDTITAALLNKMEQGVANAGGGGALLVGQSNETLDKTWQEIHDAAPLVYLTVDGEEFKPLVAVYEDEGDYCVDFVSISVDGNIFCSYIASSASGYPAKIN